jgi:hypothetical protein
MAFTAVRNLAGTAFHPEANYSNSVTPKAADGWVQA